MRIALLNILWILFTLLGFIVFGFFPATVALLSVIRDLNTEDETRIFSTFLDYFVQNFIKGNAYGYSVLIINIIFLFLSFVSAEYFSPFLTVPLFAITIMIVVISLYVYPIYIYFEATYLNHIKLATIIALGHPMLSFVLFTLFTVNVVIIFYSTILVAFPVLILFFMISGSAYLVVKIVTPVLSNIAEKSSESSDLEANHIVE